VEPDPRPSCPAVARIARTRGNRGEVLADSYTDFPERFSNLREVWLEYPDRHRERVFVEETWIHKGRQVLKFSGIDSISDAERLVGAWVLVDPGGTVSPPSGTFFDHDLVGCRVVDLAGVELGTVSGLYKIQGNTLLAVDGPKGEILVPAVDAFCREISIARRVIVVDLPDGLLDLNV